MSIFSTTANTNFNAFQDPLNPVNTNRGPWGIDPNYLTPSYNAPYRPPYTGSTGGPLQYPNPGFMRSAYGASPFYPGNQYDVGTNQQQQQFYNTLSDMPTDFGAGIIQKIGVPLAGFGIAMGVDHWWKSKSPLPWSKNNPIPGMTSMGQNFGKSMMNSTFKQFDRIMPNISTSAFARGAANVGGWVGGLASSTIIPIGITMAAQETFERFVADPYISVRENQNMLRQSFSGIAFNSGDSDRLMGRGLSRGASARIGTQLASMGARDQVFDGREIATMTSMAAQSGMLDSASSDQIAKKMQSLMKQVKVVMSLAGSRDFQEVFSSMAKLYAAGTNINELGVTSSRIAGLSGAAGISATRMMNTVGAQGQYLFQSNNLTPYLGQLSAASSMAGFSSAFRSGLISNEMMARLGGVEGASQLSTTGQLNGAQSIYNSVRAYNRYISGDGGRDVVGNMMNFGARSSADPIAMMGSLTLSRGRALSEQFKNEGFMGLHNQIMEIGNFLPGVMDRNGRIKGEHAAAIMTNQMGLSPEEAQAYLLQYSSYQNPTSRNMQIAGIRSKQAETMRDMFEQQGRTFFGSKLGYASYYLRKGTDYMTNQIGGGVAGLGDATDSSESFLTRLHMGGSAAELRGRTFGEIDEDSKVQKMATEDRGIGQRVVDGLLSASAAGGVFNTGRLVGNAIREGFTQDDKTRFSNEFSAINKHFDLGDADARKILSAGSSPKEIEDAIRRMAMAKKISSDYADDTTDSSQKIKQLASAVMYGQRADGSNASRDGDLEYTKNLDKMSKFFKEGADDMDKMSGLKTAEKLFRKMTQNGGELDMTDGETARLAKEYKLKTGKDLTQMSNVDRAVEIKALYKEAVDMRLGGVDLDKFGGEAAALKLAADPKTAKQIFGADKEAYEKYKQATTDEERRGLVVRAAGKTNGDKKILPGNKFSNPNVTLEDQLMFQDSMDAFDTDIRNIQEAAKSGRIDMGTAYSAMAGTTMMKAATLFAATVDRLAKDSGTTSGPNLIDEMVRRNNAKTSGAGMPQQTPGGGR
jgi:hypothetical protein